MECKNCDNRTIPSDMIHMYPMSEEHITYLGHLREIACSICPKNAEEWVLKETAENMMVAATRSGYQQGCVDTGKLLMERLREMEYYVDPNEIGLEVE